MPCVLVVDSHASTRAICSQFLHERGHDILEARNGRSALALAGDHNVEAVITDWVLPDMSGQQLLQELTKLARPLSVIVYSSQPHLCPRFLLDAPDRALVAKSEDLNNLLWALHQLLASRAATPQN